MVIIHVFILEGASMEHLVSILAITSLIVILFIVTNIYWDSKSNKVYKRFQELLEAAEISQRTFVEGRLREIESTMDDMKKEIESAKVRGFSPRSVEEGTRAGPDSLTEDRETMVVFGRKPGEEPSR
jgi:hypothetical protein